MNRLFWKGMNRRLLGFLTSLTAIAAIAIGLIVTDRSTDEVGAQNVATDRVTTRVTPTTTFAEPIPVTTTTNAFVVRTVDGDTIVAKLDAEPETDFTVRLLGIDTPETVDPRKPVQCFGKEASTKLRELVSGQRVRLESDPQADERDKYGRLLRNLVAEDGTDVNAFMVREGYAHAYLSFPLNRQRKEELHDLETMAREQQLGLWSPVTCPQ